MQEFIDMVMDAVFMIYRNRQLIPCVYGAIIIRKERCWIKDMRLRMDKDLEELEKDFCVKMNKE